MAVEIRPLWPPPPALRDSHICVGLCDVECGDHDEEFSPALGHGFGSGWFAVTVPAAEAGGDPCDVTE